MAAKGQPPSGKMPARVPRVKTPLSVQIARASWQFAGIAAVVAGITFSIGRRDPTVRTIAEVVVALMIAVSVGFAIAGLVAYGREDDEDSELRGPLLNNSLGGFGAVVLLLAVTIPLALSARNSARVKRDTIAAATQTPVVAETPPATERPATSGVEPAASPTGAAAFAILPVEEGRSFARSYVTLIQRNLFDEAYKYLPAEVRGRVTTKQHQDLWRTADGVDREEIVIADATESAEGRAVDVKVTIPGKADPQVVVVQKSGEKMWATPRQFVAP